jgi:hypothetical protein
MREKYLNFLCMKCNAHICCLYFITSNSGILQLVWLPSFGARIKELIYDSNNYLFGCHEIGYRIHLEFHGFHLMPNLNPYWVPRHFYGFLKMKWYHHVISFHFYKIKWNDGCQTSPKWGSPISPFGQTGQNGLLEPNQGTLSLTPLSHAMVMATELPSSLPASSGRLRPFLALPSPPKHSTHSALPSHWRNHAGVLDCILVHTHWIC